MEDVPFYAAAGPPPGADGPAVPPAFDPRATAQSARAQRAAAPAPSRFAKSEVSFGPVGRILWTLLLLVPMVWFVYAAQWLFVGAGAVIYAFVILPWALRDLWRPPRR